MALAMMESQRAQRPKTRQFSRIRFAMLSGGQPEQTIDDGVLADAKSACVALVPVIPSAQWSQTSGLQSQPNSIFVTHLIATAEQVPQTRGFRAGTPGASRTADPAEPHPAPGRRA